MSDQTNSLVAAVPVPLVSWLNRKEVGRALVLHFLGEAQEDSVVDVSYGGCVSRPWRDHREMGISSFGKCYWLNSRSWLP